MSDKFTGFKNGTYFEDGKPLMEFSSRCATPMKNHKSPLDIAMANTVKTDKPNEDVKLDEKEEM
jgi:hypothetical protein